MKKLGAFRLQTFPNHPEFFEQFKAPEPRQTIRPLSFSYLQILCALTRTPSSNFNDWKPSVFPDPWQNCRKRFRPAREPSSCFPQTIFTKPLPVPPKKYPRPSTLPGTSLPTAPNKTAESNSPST